MKENYMKFIVTLEEVARKAGFDSPEADACLYALDAIYRQTMNCCAKCTKRNSPYGCPVYYSKPNRPDSWSCSDFCAGAGGGC